MNLAERAAATGRVLAYFGGLPFDWETANCIVFAREQGIAMGHDLPPVPKFRTAKGARKALAEHGAASVAELLDQYFGRLPAPALMRVGDLCVVPGHEGLEAVMVADGQGNLFGWYDDIPTVSWVKFGMAAVTAAWRL